MYRMLKHGADVCDDIVNSVITEFLSWIIQKDLVLNALQKMNDMCSNGLPAMENSVRMIEWLLPTS